MSNDNFQDAALVLVGHGSTVNADSSAPTFQHADELRRRKLFAQVVECFWKLEPGIAAVMRGVFARRVFIVPLFISEGYFTEQVIPRELGLCGSSEPGFPRVQKKGDKTLFYCGPVGTHASLTEVILGRAREVVERHPFPRVPKAEETSLFIAGHGTGNNENSRKSIEKQVKIIRQRKIYADVQPAFMEEPPLISGCYEQAVTKNIVMVPFFISDGLHSYEDIPVMLGEGRAMVEERLKARQPTWRNPTGRKGKMVWYGRSIGSEPLLAEVILERVKEMAQRPIGEMK